MDTPPLLQCRLAQTGGISQTDEDGIWCPEDLQSQLIYFNSVLEPLGYRLTSDSSQGRSAKIGRYSVSVEGMPLMECKTHLSDGIVDLCLLLSKTGISLQTFKELLSPLGIVLLADGTISTVRRPNVKWRTEEYPSQYHVLVMDGNSGHYLARVTPETCWVELETLAWLKESTELASPSKQ